MNKKLYASWSESGLRSPSSNDFASIYIASYEIDAWGRATLDVVPNCKINSEKFLRSEYLNITGYCHQHCNQNINILQ